jgi:YfiH family protein
MVLRCRPLDAIAPHVFTTRTLSLVSRQDWSRVAEAVGTERVATLEQVHGREVVTITRDIPAPAQPPRADALVSNHPAVAVAVRTADCVPLLLADTVTGAVAAVHAGWRGTVAGVASAAVHALRDGYGVTPRTLVVAIGPSIGACCYRVGQDVVDAFAEAGHAALDRWLVRRDPGSGVRDSDVHPDVRLDLIAANRDQLILAGVLETRIHACGLCTAMHLDVLTSYRAERENAGRLAAAIRCRAYNPPGSDPGDAFDRGLTPKELL